MTKHVHAEIIKAKADNMELVLFANDPEELDDWFEYGNNVDYLPRFYDDCNYFLCLPEHKEVCLHWLNGGNVERLTLNQDWLKVGYGLAWSKCHEFMNKDLEFRIKPRKEKRFIGVHKNSRQPTPLFEEKSLCEEYVLTNSISDGTSVCEWLFIEIEVEV